MATPRPQLAEQVPTAVKLARKYKAMGLPVQRRNAVESGWYYRKVTVRSWVARAAFDNWSMQGR